MEGVRVVEVAAWTFVPAAGAVLAEWGADVLKIEHPESGDPAARAGELGPGPGGPGASTSSSSSPTTASARRPRPPPPGGPGPALPPGRDGRRVPHQLAARRPPEAARSTSSTSGPSSPTSSTCAAAARAERAPTPSEGGYDGSSYFARSGVSWRSAAADDPVRRPAAAAFGDLPGGQTIAGAIAAALLHRGARARRSIVDISLLAFGMFQNSPDIVMAKAATRAECRRFDRAESPNPLVNRYRTSDGRLVQLMMLQGLRFWPEPITAVGRPELPPTSASPRRPRSSSTGRGHRTLDETFGTRRSSIGSEALADIEGVWCAVHGPLDLLRRPAGDRQRLPGRRGRRGRLDFQLAPTPSSSTSSRRPSPGRPATASTPTRSSTSSA